VLQLQYHHLPAAAAVVSFRQGEGRLAQREEVDMRRQPGPRERRPLLLQL
jgi:hypothetical protein